jgi:hypothetical protein
VGVAVQRQVGAGPVDRLRQQVAPSEETPRYWYDGLSILARAEIEWPYLLIRARHGPRRVLSFLLFARSNGLVIPTHAVHALRSLIGAGRLDLVAA